MPTVMCHSNPEPLCHSNCLINQRIFKFKRFLFLFLFLTKGWFCTYINSVGRKSGDTSLPVSMYRIHFKLLINDIASQEITDLILLRSSSCNFKINFFSMFPNGNLFLDGPPSILSSAPLWNGIPTLTLSQIRHFQEETENPFAPRNCSCYLYMYILSRRLWTHFCLYGLALSKLFRLIDWLININY